jgi:pyruvate dehydrogenase E1 component subunit alpha
MGTAVERASATRDFHTRADAYDMPGEHADGMDVLAVREAVARARKHALAGKGPTLLEMKTYRFRAHSMSDPARYRTRAEVDVWRERDPLVTFPARLIEEEVTTAEEIEAVREEVAREVEACIAFAEESPHPEPADLMRHLWAGDEPEDLGDESEPRSAPFDVAEDEEGDSGEDVPREPAGPERDEE